MHNVNSQRLFVHWIASKSVPTLHDISVANIYYYICTLARILRIRTGLN